MSFQEKWINFLHRAATGTKKTRTLLTPVGITVFVAFTAIFVVAALWVDRLCQRRGRSLPSQRQRKRRIRAGCGLAYASGCYAVFPLLPGL